MSEITANKIDYEFDRNLNLILKFSIGKANREVAEKIIEELSDSNRITLKVSKYKEKRSLDSNSYAWVLMGELAEAINLPVAEVYKRYVRELGIFNIVPIRNDAVEMFKTAWQKNGIGWQVQSLGTSKIEGYENLMCYYGSSVFDKRQMNRLLEMIVEDCKQEGIETMTPQELEALKERRYLRKTHI